MANFYNVVYYDRFAHFFVTEKDPYATPERYLEISKNYLHQLHEQIKDQGLELLKEQEETEFCDRCGRRKVKSNREVK